MGGVRVGAGRKRLWRGETKMMRLPVAHEAAIVAYARALDCGLVGALPEQKMVSLSVVQQEMERVLLSMPPSKRRVVASRFRVLLLALGQVQLLGGDHANR